MGEPGGVGGEITVKAWQALRDTGLSFFVIADPARLEHIGAQVAVINEPSEARAAFEKKLPVMPVGAQVISIPGRADPRYAELVIDSIRRAVSYAIKGEAAGVVTNPIQKATLIDAGFAFPGHTEFLADLTKDATLPDGLQRGPVMMLAGPRLRTIPVTIHEPLAQAINNLTAEKIIDIVSVTASALNIDFGVEKPRLAVSGLNPHAGENGALGSEDADIIEPAIKELINKGFDARGPLPADTMFHDEARATYDAAICMYHDQALIPAKALNFHDAVNVTLGLPIVRTSPDHGTALDIAGKDLARTDSLIAAINLAAEMAARRAGAK